MIMQVADKATSKHHHHNNKLATNSSKHPNSKPSALLHNSNRHLVLMNLMTIFHFKKGETYEFGINKKSSSGGYYDG